RPHSHTLFPYTTLFRSFGLLGVNGAGKTTTFGMITGDLFPSYGDCYQGNLSISKDKLAYQENLGYCPQFNPLLESLTGRETLFLDRKSTRLNSSHLVIS